MTGISISLSSRPNSPFHNEHYHCDYIELLALSQNSDIVSLEDVRSRYTNFEGEFDDLIGDVNLQEQNNSCYVDDKWASRIHDWFLMLETRSLSYGDAYPFNVVDRNTLSLKNNLTEINYVYIFLLISSLLNYFSKAAISSLTSDFEIVALHALSKYLPGYAVSRKFGKSNTSNDRYVGNIANKIDLLAEDLKKNICYEPRYFSDRDIGDLGIDLVAWLPISEDECYSYIQIIFAQCAAGKNWLKKQDEPIRSVKNCISRIDNPINMMFIPYDARNADRNFHEEAKIESSLLLFDRRRIVSLLSGSAEMVCELASFAPIIIGMVNFEEALV